MKRNNIRIMVVDDMSGMRSTLRNTLQVLGYYDVVEAQSGDEALRKLRTSEEFDLVISDWSMPAMDGLEFHQALKKSPLLRKTPFLMISAKAERDNVIAAFKAGISHFMVKPFSAEALQDKLSSMLGVVA